MPEVYRAIIRRYQGHKHVMSAEDYAKGDHHGRYLGEMSAKRALSDLRTNFWRADIKADMSSDGNVLLVGDSADGSTYRVWCV